jgi:hypothetical protein
VIGREINKEEVENTLAIPVTIWNSSTEDEMPEMP